MTNKFDIRKINLIINFLYILIVLFIVYIAFRYALPLVFPFLIALAISYFTRPAVNLLTHRFRINNKLASFICISMIFIVFFALLFLLSSTVFQSARLVYKSIPNYIDDVKQYVNELSLKNTDGKISVIENAILNIFDYIRSIDIKSVIIGRLGSYAINSFSGIMISIPYVFMTFIIIYASSVFISISFEQIRDFILFQFSENKKKVLLDIKNSATSILKKYIKSYATLMIITFAELTLLFAVFKIRPAATLAFIMSAIDILPVLGVGTVIIPWAITCFLCGSITKGTVLLSIYILVAVIRQIIEPKIVGKNIGLHPVSTLIAIYVGLKLLGILGLFVAPMSLIIISDLQRKGYISLWKEKNS